MKKIALLGLLIVSLSPLNAQTKSISFNQGMELQYTVYPMGQVVPFSFKLDTMASGTLMISYNNENGRGGKYFVPKISLDSATDAFWGPPHFDQDITLESHESLLLFPKKLFHLVKQNGKVVYDGFAYLRKEGAGKSEFAYEDKTVNTIYIESENGKTRIWVLDNPSFPLLLKVEGNPEGVDLQMEHVKLIIK